MLEISQLTRCYGNFKAVDNVSFTIGKGEIVGLLGHNGAGKTTIMKMLSGYIEPDQGNVIMDGSSLDDDLKSIQSQIGYLPESLPVYPEMIVADYLDYAADLKGLNETEKKSEIRRAVLATDILEKLVSPISTLSRGYKQRVGVAQAILGQPKLLILDEPTNGLDPEQTQHMRTLIREIAKNATVILSTHIMQEVDALCTRVLMLNRGSLVVDAQLEDLRLSNHVILECTLPESNSVVLSSIEGVHGFKCTSGDGAQTYRIELDRQQGGDVVYELRALCSRIARAVFEKGYDVFRLVPEQRDLETLFKEVNENSYAKEIKSDAA